MSRWRTRAATSRRYSAVERTSSIGWSSAASVSAARSAVSGVGRPALEGGLGGAGTDRRGGHRPERDPHVASTARPGSPSRQPSATTTLLIDWARRVPTLRKRSSRPASSGIRMRRSSSSGGQRRLAVGRPELVGRDDPLAARRAEHERRVGRQQDRQRVAGRRGVGDVAAERAAVLDLGRADRRGRLDQHGEMLATHRRAPDVRVRRQRAEAERVAVERDARAARRAATGRGSGRAARPARRSGRPSGRCRRRSAGPAPSARTAYASARSRGLMTGGSTGIDGQPPRAATPRRAPRAGARARRGCRSRPPAASARPHSTGRRPAGSSTASAGGSASGSSADGRDGMRAAAVRRDRDAIGVVAHWSPPSSAPPTIPRLPGADAARAIASTILV